MAGTTETPQVSSLATSASVALANFNHDMQTQWTWGESWSNVGTQFETFINKYLFPKINETTIANQRLGNKFDFLADEVNFIGQYSEEYVITDSIPTAMNLSKSAELMLRKNYPKMATKLYNSMLVKKQKFTLNNNDARQNFLNLQDATRYALGVYQKKIDDINVDEETTIKGMIVDYALNQTKEKREATSMEDLASKIFIALLNLQSNTHEYNETDKASGGTGLRYTTRTKLSDVFIMVSDDVKAYLLDTKIANTFQASGLDITNHIVSFPNLGGTFRITEDVTIASDDTITGLQNLGDYQIEKGDIIPKGAVFTADITQLTDFKGNIEEIKPASDLFASIMDVNKLRYKRYTKGMLKQPFYDGERDEVTHWIHYATMKSMSPFYNNIVIQGK